MSSSINGGANLEPAGGERSPRAACACPACGATARRAEARFCATCGRSLDGGDYFPTDSLLSSYHQQQRRPTAPVLTATPAPARRSRGHADAAPRPRPRLTTMPFDKHNNRASATALAFVTYALVPYLGILFCPGALLWGGVGLLRARRAPHVGGRSASALSITLGLLILCVQVLLWWLLYKVPEWSRRSPF